jgi:hypothetical protein
VERKRRRVIVRADEFQPEFRVHGGHRQEHTLQLFQFRCWCGELEFEFRRDGASLLGEHVWHYARSRTVAGIQAANRTKTAAQL